MHLRASQEWYIGVDLGTGSCKSVVIDAQARVLGFGASAYTGQDVSSQWQEQDPEALLAATIHSVRLAVTQAGLPPSGCQALSLGGAYHSLIALDQRRKPLTGVLTWIDSRAARQAQAARQAGIAQELYRQTGCPAHALYPLYKLIWLKHEQPHIFERAAHFISAKEYVLERLCGEALVDHGIAAGSGLLNVHDLTWNPASLELAGISPDQLSPLGSSTDLLPALKPHMAAEMGIPKDTALVLGSADAVNSSLGTGAVMDGQATCMIGTSGALRLIAREPVLDPQARTWCYAIDPGHWLVGGAINNAGLALSWFHNLLNQIPQFASQGTQLSFDDLIELAGQAPAGADGLICLPFLAGERSPYWNMNARLVFFGLALQHDVRHLARALLEGVAFRLCSLKEVLLEIGQSIHHIRASGGFTHSHLWPQIIASTLQRELVVPTWGETSSLGAALWAMLGTGALASFADIHPLVPLGEAYAPQADEAALYARLYALYKGLYASLRPAFDQLAEIRN